jgi:hypothetical protein
MSCVSTPPKCLHVPACARITDSSHIHPSCPTTWHIGVFGQMLAAYRAREKAKLLCYACKPDSVHLAYPRKLRTMLQQIGHVIDFVPLGGLCRLGVHRRQPSLHQRVRSSPRPEWVPAHPCFQRGSSDELRLGRRMDPRYDTSGIIRRGGNPPLFDRCVHNVFMRGRRYTADIRNGKLCPLLPRCKIWGSKHNYGNLLITHTL